MADVEEKHIIHHEPMTLNGKMVWLLKIYYPNQGGVVKTVYAPESPDIIDLTLEQELQPSQEPPEPEPVVQVQENAL